MKLVYKNIISLIARTRFSISIFVVMLIFSLLGYQVMKINMLKNAQQVGDNLSRTYSLEQQSDLELYSVLLSFGMTIVDSAADTRELTDKMMYFFQTDTASARRGDC